MFKDNPVAGPMLTCLALVVIACYGGCCIQLGASHIEDEAVQSGFATKTPDGNGRTYTFKWKEANDAQD